MKGDISSVIFYNGYMASSKEPIRIKNEEKYMKEVKRNKYRLTELITNEREVKPYYDVDKYYDKEPKREEEEKLNTKHKGLIEGLYPEKKIRVAKRDTRYDKEKGLFKVSYRYYVLGVRTYQKEIKKGLEGLKEDNDFDKGVYNNNRSMVCIYCKKPVGDIPILEPYEDKNPKIEEYIISKVEEGWEKIGSMEEGKGSKEGSIRIPSHTLETGLQITKYEQLGRIIDHISVDRSDSYDSWIEGMWAIRGACHRYGLNQEREYNLVHRFSKKSKKKYDKEGVDKEISKPFRVLKGLRSLIEWLKQDDYKFYVKEFPLSKELYKLLDNCVYNQGVEYDVAQIVYHQHKEDIKYDPEGGKGGVWFYNNPDTKIWERYEEAVFFTILCGNEISSMFTKISGEYVMKSIEAQTQNRPDDVKRWGDLHKVALKISNMCKKTSFCKAIQTQCKGLMISVKFNEELDEDPYLFAFKNCVFDMSMRDENNIRGVLRSIEPKDKISITTGYDYQPADPNVVQKIMSFYKDILPDEDVMNYTLDLDASILEGGNKDRLFVLRTGEGANGKSIHGTLLENCLGDYTKQLHSNVVLKATLGANDHSDLAFTKGKRLAIIKEPDDQNNRAKLQNGTVKEITGNEKTTQRGIWEKAKTFKIQFIPFMFCNTPPQPAKCEQAMADRIRVIEYETRFVENPTKHFEKKIDLKLEVLFSDRIDEEGNKPTEKKYRTAMINILMEVWKSRVSQYEDKIPTPEKVLMKSKIYMDECDPIVQFLKSRCIFTENEKDRLASKQLYDKYREYMRDNSMNIEIINELSFSQKMRQISMKGDLKFNRKHTKNGNVWTNIQMKRDHNLWSDSDE